MSLYFKNQTAKFIISIKQKTKFMKQTLLKHQKIITLVILLFVTQFAKAQNFQLLTNNGFVTSGGSAPQGPQRWCRTVFLVTATEMAAAGVTNGQQFNYLKLNQYLAAAVPASGTVQIYLQNSTN